MTKLNLAATKIMGRTSFTRGQSRQMILQVMKDSNCDEDVARHAIEIQLDKIKSEGKIVRIDSTITEDPVIN